jgi:5'-methylthioadenosine phosphorylase
MSDKVGRVWIDARDEGVTEASALCRPASSGYPFPLMTRPLKIGLIGGSGLGAAMQARTHGTPQYINTPFGKPSSTIIETTWEGVPVLFLARHGPGHVLQPSNVPYRANIYALKSLGCTHIIASGAVGSLREEFRPRELVVPDQVIDNTYLRENTFFERSAVHVEFAEPFCPVLRQTILTAAKELPQSPDAPKVHDGGCYVAMEGPAFSSKAESLMHRLWGGDLIGMTALPEAKLAKEAELPYALIALVTDYDCWRAPPAPKEGETPKKQDELLKEIIANLASATDNAIALMQATLRRIAASPTALESCPAQKALELAIWTDKNQIDPDEVRKLAPLWGKYFG